MLFEAVYWPADRERPASVDAGLAPPELEHILAGWGRTGDRALLLQADGEPVGAAWLRLWNDTENSYGYVASGVPVLGIALRREWRGQGYGRELINRLLERAKEDGATEVSLSVEKDNPSRFLYQSVGFVTVDENEDDYIMVCSLGQGS